MEYRLLFIAFCGLTVTVLYIYLTRLTIEGGSVFYVILVTWVTSPISFYIMAIFFENDPIVHGGRGETAIEVFKNVFNLKTQAWSFIFGDIFVLPAAFVVAAHKWSEMPGLIDPPVWWLVMCLITGSVVGLGFHFWYEKPLYIQQGAGESLDSPTKLLHDFVSYPVLFGGLLCVFVPLVVTPSARELPWLQAWYLNDSVIKIMLLIAIWSTLGVIDHFRNLIPWGHPKYAVEQQRCIT
jgi:hypothetical protein